MESKCANFLNANNIHLYFQCNQSKTEKIKSKLYADVHNFWSEIQAIEQPNSAVIKNQVIWENRYITIHYFNNAEIKITQLADDTTCFLKDKKSLQHVLDIFKDFEICSGLKVNIDKTIAKVLGPEPLPSNYLDGLTWTFWQQATSHDEYLKW